MQLQKSFPYQDRIYPLRSESTT